MLGQDSALIGERTCRSHARKEYARQFTRSDGKNLNIRPSVHLLSSAGEELRSATSEELDTSYLKSIALYFHAHDISITTFDLALANDGEVHDENEIRKVNLWLDLESK